MALKRQYEALREKNDAMREGFARVGDELRRRVADLQRSSHVDAAASEQLIREAAAMGDISRATAVGDVHASFAQLRKVLGALLVSAAGTSLSDNPLVNLNNTTASSEVDVTPRESARSDPQPRSSRTQAGASVLAPVISTTSSGSSGNLQKSNSFTNANRATGGGGGLHRRSQSGYLSRNVHAMKIVERRTLLSVIVAPRIARIEHFATERLRDLEKMIKDRDITHRAKLRKLEQMAEGDEPKIVTLRRLEALDFTFCVVAKDLDLVFFMITLCEHENLSVICGAILGEVIEILRDEAEQQQQQQLHLQQQAASPDGGHGPVAFGALALERSTSTPLGDSAVPISARSPFVQTTQHNLQGATHSFPSAATVGGGGAGGASAVNNATTQLLAESEALDQRFSFASAELENLAGRVRSEVANLVVRAQLPGSSAMMPDPTEISSIPRSVRPTMAKLSGLLYWTTLWFHLLVIGLLEAEAALQLPTLSTDSENSIKLYLGVWGENLGTIRRLLGEVKDAMTKLERLSSERQGSPLVASPPPSVSHHHRDSSFGGVGFVDGADTTEASALQAAAPTTTATTAVMLYFSITAHGDTRSLASPGQTPALLDATPSKTTSLRRDSSSPKLRNLGVASASPFQSSRQQHQPQQQPLGDKSSFDHFAEVLDAVGELEVKLSRMENSVEKLLKSTETYGSADQHVRRSAELPPHVQKLCRMAVDE